MKLSVVVPARNEAGALPELIDRLADGLTPMDLDWEVVIVDDGSTDETWPLLKSSAGSDPRLRGIRLSRNFGHQVALTAGLGAAEGDAVITMDGDLQHPPELIPAMIAKASEGFEVVYAIRTRNDSEGWLKVIPARAFYWMLNRLSSLDLPDGGADFRYMSRPVVDALLQMPERHRFLRGMSRWVGYSQAFIEYDRSARSAGRSKYTFGRMARFAFDAIINFSALPLRIASLLGLFLSFLGGVYFVYALAARALTESTVPGWTSVIGVVLLLGGVQLACLGIMGQYVGRMYDEVKGRPLFLVWEDTRDPHESQQEALRSAPLTGRLVEGKSRSSETPARALD